MSETKSLAVCEVEMLMREADREVAQTNAAWKEATAAYHALVKARDRIEQCETRAKKAAEAPLRGPLA